MNEHLQKAGYGALVFFGSLWLGGFAMHLAPDNIFPELPILITTIILMAVGLVFIAINVADYMDKNNKW